MALGFFFDVTMCIGCRTCQVACKDRNGLKVGIVFRRVRSFETGHYPEALSYNYSGSCNHCKDARCVKGCPSGAMYHAEDGTVQHDRQKCLGCGYCTWNCPYGVPQLDEEAGIVGKCDSCKPLRDAGKNPVCVDAAWNSAISTNWRPGTARTWCVNCRFCPPPRSPILAWRSNRKPAPSAPMSGKWIFKQYRSERRVLCYARHGR